VSNLESSQGLPEGHYRRVVDAWAMYDWANSAFTVTILTAVFPVYYRSLVTSAGGGPEDATAYWAYTTSLSILVIAALGPVLGAIADIVSAKKRFLGVALICGVLGSASLALLGEGTFVVASCLFAIANLGFAGGNIFYEALLPHIARPNDFDRVSVRGYAFGYLGGGLFLVFCFILILRPEWFWMANQDSALRASFVGVAVWWFVFSLPLFFNIEDARYAERASISLHVIRDGWQRLVNTVGQVRRYRQLTLFLAAFWLYNDGIGTIIKLAAAYGDEIGIRRNDLLTALILTQFILSVFRARSASAGSHDILGLSGRFLRVSRSTLLCRSPGFLSELPGIFTCWRWSLAWSRVGRRR